MFVIRAALHWVLEITRISVRLVDELDAQTREKLTFTTRPVVLNPADSPAIHSAVGVNEQVPDHRSEPIGV